MIPVPAYLPFPLHFALFFLSFHLFLCFQLPSNIIVYRFVRRGSILFEKARSSPPIIFWSNPPLLRHLKKKWHHPQNLLPPTSFGINGIVWHEQTLFFLFFSLLISSTSKFRFLRTQVRYSGVDKSRAHLHYYKYYLLDWCDSGKCCTSMEQKVIGKKVVGATPLFFRSLTLTPKYSPCHV